VQKGQRKIDEASLRYSKGCCCEGRKNKETHRSFLVLYTYIIGIHGSANGGGGHEMVERKTFALDAREANIVGDEMEQT